MNVEDRAIAFQRAIFLLVDADPRTREALETMLETLARPAVKTALSMEQGEIAALAEKWEMPSLAQEIRDRGK